MEKSKNNRTIALSVEETQEYLKRCSSVSAPAELDQVENKTILGDTFSVLSCLPRGSVDLLIADPPYNLDKDFGGRGFRQMGDEEYAVYTRQWIEAAMPLLKPEASVYVCCDWRSSMVVGTVLKEFFHIQNRITWQREKGRGAQHNWKNAMEDIWFCTCSDQYTFHIEDVMVRRRVIASYRVDGQPKDWEETGDGKFRNTYPSNFWDDISIPYWSMPENAPHPTQKPEKLLAKLILASSNPGDLVLDPFLGSGSTSVTAKKLGRRFIGIEQNPQICAWAEKRLEMAEESSRIQGYTDGVFWERNSLNHQKK